MHRKKIKQLVAGILLSSMLCGSLSSISAYAQTYHYTRVKSDMVYLYMLEKPSDDASPVAVLKSGDICRVLNDTDDEWVKVFSGGFTGYIRTDDLVDAPIDIAEIIPYQGVVIEKDTQIYAAPDESSKVVATRHKGATELPVYNGNSSDEWLYISVVVDSSGNRVSGYVSTQDAHLERVVNDAEPYFGPIKEYEEARVAKADKLRAAAEAEAKKAQEARLAELETIESDVTIALDDTPAIEEAAKEPAKTTEQTEVALEKPQQNNVEINVQEPSPAPAPAEATQQAAVPEPAPAPTPAPTPTPEPVVENGVEVVENPLFNEASAADVTGKAVDMTQQQPQVAQPQVAASTWTGPVLNRVAGTVQGPSGKETYYNLDMSGIVNSIKNHTWIWNDASPGNQQNLLGDYWVREDGVKMLGPYVMCAANLAVHPRGSLVPTSLGTGVVVDTGGFAASNSHQLDLATSW